MHPWKPEVIENTQ